jgi:hypothetical protein
MIATSSPFGQRRAFWTSLVFEGKCSRAWIRIALVALALLHFASGAHAGQRELNLIRSLYVPVRFVACQHVTNIVMSVHGDETVFPLGLRTFLFTYDTERNQLLPQSVDVRISGEHVDSGEAFLTNVIIAPDGVLSSVDSSKVDWESVRQKARIRRDIRFSTRQVLITSDPDCEKKVATVANAAAQEERPAAATPASP